MEEGGIGQDLVRFTDHSKQVLLAPESVGGHGVTFDLRKRELLAGDISAHKF